MLHEKQPSTRVSSPQEALEILLTIYANPHTALRHSSPFQLLIATVLSAQCTDERVNGVTSILFERYSTVADFAAAHIKELEKVIRPTGLFRTKAAAIKEISRILLDHYQGAVPQTLVELTALPGVGRKTANVILSECFGIPSIVVDTHVKRVANRLGWVTHTNPTKIEEALMEQWPRRIWSQASRVLILHGRAICSARAPACGQCAIRSHCAYPDTNTP